MFVLKILNVDTVFPGCLCFGENKPKAYCRCWPGFQKGRGHCFEKKNGGGLTEDAGQVMLRTPSPKMLRTPGPVEDPES